MSVVIPWHGDDIWRCRSLSWVKRRYRTYHPTWEVVVGRGGDPWVKADAVADGIGRASGETIVVADADVWCPKIGDSVDHVTNGRGWSQPHRLVHRLNHEATARVFNGSEPADYMKVKHLTQRPYPGKLGGGIVVIDRDMWDRTPMDRRFQGWGGEDEAWGLALSRLEGRPRWFGGKLIHLWHPPQDTMRQEDRHGRPRRRPQPDLEDLVNRYRVAARSPQALRELVDGGR